jgi:large subunit ribosomal protein L17
MRHRKHHTKLTRKSGPRRQLIRNLSAALITHERILTTEAKAKALRPLVERLVTLGKKGTLHHRRMAFAALQKKQAVHKLFEEIAPRFTERPGGYTRIIRGGQRSGDGAWMAYIEFVERSEAAIAAMTPKKTEEPAAAEE